MPFAAYADVNWPLRELHLPVDSNLLLAVCLSATQHASCLQSHP